MRSTVRLHLVQLQVFSLRRNLALDWMGAIDSRQLGPKAGRRLCCQCARTRWFFYFYCAWAGLVFSVGGDPKKFFCSMDPLAVVAEMQVLDTWGEACGFQSDAILVSPSTLFWFQCIVEYHGHRVASLVCTRTARETCRQNGGGSTLCLQLCIAARL